MPTIDVIGDIHGYPDKLRWLLSRLGYEQSGGVYGSPDRRVIFVGDLIDRGPAIGEVMEIVAGMLRAGAALLPVPPDNSQQKPIDLSGYNKADAIAQAHRYPSRTWVMGRDHVPFQIP